MEFSETEIKLFIVFHGDYFIIILSKFIFIIFQEREEKSDQANVAIGEAKAKEVSVFVIFLLYVITNLSHYQEQKTLLKLQHLDQFR